MDFMEFDDFEEFEWCAITKDTYLCPEGMKTLLLITLLPMDVDRRDFRDVDSSFLFFSRPKKMESRFDSFSISCQNIMKEQQLD